ncbi:MAG TPA: hypothetical protein PKD78_13370 [Saprospiraceae bacterium]|nr:hypothetical protein [Saprospiraceae bacterium]
MISTQLLRCCALVLFLAAAQVASANTAADPAQLRTEWVARLQNTNTQSDHQLTEKQARRLEKWQYKTARKVAKKATPVDFSDSTERWLWLGLFGLGITILMGVLGIGVLAGLIGLAAVVCLVVWVLKKTGTA